MKTENQVARLNAFKGKGCRRQWNGNDDWNAEFKAGVVKWLIYDKCQSAEQHLEAAVKEALVSYSVDANGLLRGTPAARVAQ